MGCTYDEGCTSNDMQLIRFRSDVCVARDSDVMLERSLFISLRAAASQCSMMWVADWKLNDMFLRSHLTDNSHLIGGIAPWISLEVLDQAFCFFLSLLLVTFSFKWFADLAIKSILIFCKKLFVQLKHFCGCRHLPASVLFCSALGRDS